MTENNNIDPRNRRDQEREAGHTIDESELREPPDYIEDVGPEDASPEEKMELIQEYGYDQMDEGDFESSVTAESDQPDTWMNHESLERSNVANANDAHDLEEDEI